MSCILFATFSSIEANERRPREQSRSFPSPSGDINQDQEDNKTQHHGNMWLLLNSGRNDIKNLYDIFKKHGDNCEEYDCWGKGSKYLLFCVRQP